MSPLCVPLPTVIKVKLLPNKSSSALLMSRVLVSASVPPARLIARLLLPGLMVKLSVPVMAAVHTISLAVKLVAPMPVKAALTVKLPVPALMLSVLPAPAMALASVILALLALLFKTKLSVMASVTPVPPMDIEPAPAVARVVVKVPAKLTLAGPPAAGTTKLNALPPMLKVSLAPLPKIKLPLVINGVVV